MTTEAEIDQVLDRLLDSPSSRDPCRSTNRIVVPGRSFVGARLTPAAYAHGVALTLPEKVVMARPTGVGRAITTYDMLIEGRDEWLAAAARQFA